MVFLLAPASEQGLIRRRYKKKGTYQAPQSVVNNTKFCGGKYCVILHPEAGYAAVGRPQEVVSIVLVEIAVVMADGMSAR